MILNTTSKNDVIKIGESNSKQATINQDKIAKLQSMLTEGLYTNPIAATLTELSNNAIDSIVMSGKDPIENPTIVKLYKENDEYFLTITDNGLGLNKEEFENVVMSYLTSTKEDSSSAIGHFGIGAKSFLSLNRPSEWTCRKDNVEYKFIAYKGSEFLEYDLIFEKETTEENGVSIKIKIHDWYEYNKFQNEAKKQLSYYDEITLIIDEVIVKNTIYRNDLFQFCDNTPYSSTHLTLKDVTYKLDFGQLGISQLNIPVALRFNLDSGLIPSISRETLVYNAFTKQLILNRIKEVADYFINKYNETTHYQTFKQAYDNIDCYRKSVTLCGKEFEINELEKYTDIKTNDTSVEGINNLNLVHFKKNIGNNLDHYYDLSAIDNSRGVWKKDKLYREESLFAYFFHNNGNVVVINESLTGKVKSFLRDKYGSETYYIYKKADKRILKNKHVIIERQKEDGSVEFEPRIVYDNTSYHAILKLNTYKKEQWRSVISEYQKTMLEIVSPFVIEHNIEGSEEFVIWCEDLKQEQKERRAENKISGNYVSKSINKEKGDITISLFQMNKYSNGLKREVFTKRIEDLYKTDRLSVYFDKKNDEVSGNLFELYKLFPTINFILLNTTEIKHVEKLHNYIPFKNFKMSKPFARLATSIMARDILGLTPTEQVDIIVGAFPKYEALRQKIKQYVNNNQESYGVSAWLKSVVLEEATETNNWDMNIYPEVLEFKQIVSKFGFLNYLKNLDSYRTTEEDKAVINNLVYIMYKNNKINAEVVENMVLVPRSSLCIDSINNEELVPITESLSLSEQLMEY